jgi:DNA polymerase III subunit delta'
MVGPPGFVPQASGWPVVGHDGVIGMLRRSINRSLLSHAYLFSGPGGTGKRTLALAFAMTLNCQADAAEGSAVPDVACGFCGSCSRALRGEHPDIVEINLETQAAAEDAGKKATPAKEVKIDTIREMLRTVGLSPYMGRWKVYILGDADRMNEEAANALLKTLEEPPSQTMLLLLASDETAVLPTISSRCILVPLRLLSREQIAASLQEGWSAEPEQAEKLAALSGGRLGWAVRMLQNPGGLANRSSALEEMALLAGSPISERINVAARFAKKFTDARQDLYTSLDVWESWWRDVIMLRASAPELVMNVDQMGALGAAARRVPSESAHEAILLIQQTRRQLMENVNPRLALEALALGLP